MKVIVKETFPPSTVEWKGKKYLPGEEIPDLPEKEAKRLLDAGKVEALKGRGQTTAGVVEPEAKASTAAEAKAAKEADAKAKATKEAKADAEAKAKDEESDIVKAAAKAVKEGDVTADGKPTVEALDRILGRNITAAERDEAWEKLAGAAESFES